MKDWNWMAAKTLPCCPNKSMMKEAMDVAEKRTFDTHDERVRYWKIDRTKKCLIVATRVRLHQ